VQLVLATSLTKAIQVTKLRVGMKQRLPLAYNQAVAKHVEGLFIPYLDESSNLSGSTDEYNNCPPERRAFLFYAEALKAQLSKADA